MPPSFDLLHIDQQGMYEGTLQAYRKAEENAKSQRLGIWQTVARSSSLPSLPDAGQVSSFFSFLLRVVRTLRRNIGPHKDKDMDMDKDKDGAKDNKTQNCRRGTPYEKEEKQER